MAEWYLAVPEYSLWIMALTLPKILAYMRAGRRKRERKKSKVSQKNYKTEVHFIKVKRRHFLLV